MASGRVGPDHAAGPLPPATAMRRSDAINRGITRDQLRGPRYLHLRRDLYLVSDTPRDDVVDAHAWMTLLPDAAALYGSTAARWYELPVPPDPDFHVIVPAGGAVPRRRPGLVPHEGLRTGQAWRFGGLKVTTPERTWLDLSLILGPVALVVAGDAMVAAGLTFPSRLVQYADATRGRRGIVRARQLARSVRERVDSPQETRLRLAIVAGDLPCPEVNPDVFDDAGGWIGRPDLAYPALKISIQYEGDVHRTNAKRWRADISRDELLIEHGWAVIRVTADDLRHPERLCRRIRRSMDRQAALLARA